MSFIDTQNQLQTDVFPPPSNFHPLPIITKYKSYLNLETLPTIW